MKKQFVRFAGAVTLGWLLLSGCSPEKPPEEVSDSGEDTRFAQLVWIAGEWQREVDKKIYRESWEVAHALQLNGRAYKIVDGDTTVTELLSLEQIGDDIFYIPIVSHNPGPVKFKLVRVDESEAVFENMDHDYPNRIIYRRQEDGGLHARIEGKTAGENARDFYYRRVD